MRMAGILACGLALAVPMAAAASETLKVRSKALDLADTELGVVLHVPAGAGPFPAVIHLNSSGGGSDRTLQLSPQVFLPKGLAVAVVDTFTPRGIRDTIADQARISALHMAVDALNVAEALRRDSRFQAERIAVMGHSKGAIAAYVLASPDIFETLGGKKPFGAHMLLAPSCELQSRSGRTLGPLNAVVGEKDDYTPASTCVTLFESLQKAGQPVKYQVIAGANHSMSISGGQFDRSIYTLRGCQDKPLVFHSLGRYQAADGTILSSADTLRRCEARGASVGGGREKMNEALAYHADFVKSLGW